MGIGELIERLQAIRAAQGDVQVMVLDPEREEAEQVDECMCVYFRAGRVLLDPTADQATCDALDAE